jgi:hypothetical protein
MYRPRMHRLVWAPLLLLCAACGDSEDDRPLELDYLTTAIFAPTCGATQCHSTFTQAGNLVLDNPERVRQGLLDNGLIQFNSTKYDPADADQADLIIWITQTDPFGLGVGRMPLDAPMPNKDVLLLEEWIAAEAPGAQCNPNLNEGRACNNKEVFQCNPNWTFGTRLMTCTGDCVLGVCR